MTAPATGRVTRPPGLLDIGFAGEEWAESVAFFISASEAIDLAFVLAQELTGRTPIACRELAYHGSVGLARAVSVHPLWSASLASVTDADARDLRLRPWSTCDGCPCRSAATGGPCPATNATSPVSRTPGILAAPPPS